MDICEKIAYIKGLAEGLQLDDTTKEGKILLGIIELLEDMTTEICDIEDACDDMSEQLDAVDEDLSRLEDCVYDDECDCCDDDCDCCDDELYEVECPACHDVIYLDEEMLVKVLTEPRNAIIKQYQKLLEMDEVKLNFEEEALLEVAKKAVEKKTGARARRAIIEEFMMDIMYEIPKDDAIGEVTITKDYILGKGAPISESRGSY